jgi:4-carboxymuconolactone decarboxylase
VDSDPERRRRGLETMTEVYGWEMSDGEGDFFGYTSSPRSGTGPASRSATDACCCSVSWRANGDHDVLPIQLGAAFANGELDETALREIAIFLSHYAGWPAGARLFTQIEKVLADAAKARAAQDEAP